jgi:hypothetical protein
MLHRRVISASLVFALALTLQGIAGLEALAETAKAPAPETAIAPKGSAMKAQRSPRPPALRPTWRSESKGRTIGVIDWFHVCGPDALNVLQWKGPDLMSLVVVEDDQRLVLSIAERLNFKDSTPGENLIGHHSILSSSIRWNSPQPIVGRGSDKNGGLDKSRTKPLEKNP